MVLNSVASEHSKRNYAKALPLARVGAELPSRFGYVAFALSARIALEALRGVPAEGVRERVGRFFSPVLWTQGGLPPPAYLVGNEILSLVWVGRALRYGVNNRSLSSSQAPSSPGNNEPAVIPITLNSRIMIGLSLTGRSMIRRNCRSGVSR